MTPAPPATELKIPWEGSERGIHQRCGARYPYRKPAMKTPFFLLVLVPCASLLSSCVYDDGYAYRQVSVSASTPSYYGDFDEYTPYYSHANRRYYPSQGRYVYYDNQRPYYVRSLPRAAYHVAPQRHVSVSHVRYDHNRADHRYSSRYDRRRY